MKTVSIIIPVYNAEKTIRKCIESIIKQSSENWEVIAIDDGSSDESYAILQEYAKSYPDKIYALTQKNAGVTKTRERGIQSAHGTYIMFVDNDDYIESNYVNLSNPLLIFHLLYSNIHPSYTSPLFYAYFCIFFNYFHFFIIFSCIIIKSGV